MTVVGISFVGQCHTVGYAGVPADAAFPRVCRGAIEAARPGTRVEVKLQPCFHPAELVPSVRAALRSAPHVIIIEAPGWLAVAGTPSVDLSRLPKSLRSAYDRVKHFRHVSRAILRDAPRAADLVTRVDTQLGTAGRALLRPLLPRHARPSVAEYERCLADALALVVAAPSTRAVVQGPGAPNMSIDPRSVASDLPQRFVAVREMARRVADQHGALFVDRWDTITKNFYSDASPRPSAEGHSIFGQLLAAELLQAGFV